jgi:hypothetical protein
VISPWEVDDATGAGWGICAGAGGTWDTEIAGSAAAKVDMTAMPTNGMNANPATTINSAPRSMAQAMPVVSDLNMESSSLHASKTPPGGRTIQSVVWIVAVRRSVRSMERGR